MYRPGGAPELGVAIVLLAIATGLCGCGLSVSQGDSPDGGPGRYFAFIALMAGAVFFGWHGASMLLGIDSRRLSARVGVMSLALGLIPYFLLFGRPVYALNAVFLVAALSSGLAILLRRSSYR
jgi:hypothetical protein